MSAKDKKSEKLKLLEEKIRRLKTNNISRFYPETGPLSRDKYVPHMKFFKAGAKYRERLALCGNRVGKSVGMGGIEVTYHATGKYPDWWEGYVFTHPVKIRVCGKTGQTVRDIIQKILIGPPGAKGTGLIPEDCLIKTTPKAGGVPDAIDTVTVRHISGGESTIGFKAYTEGRSSFEGTEQDVVWEDEEPPYNIHTENLIRTMGTGVFNEPGLMLCTFTPLEGMSETVMAFLKGGKLPDGREMVENNKYIVMATWDDAPHLSESEKKILWDELPPYERDARSKGIPQLGSGAIYPILEKEVTIDDFEIPEYWPKIYGFDVGWNCTAAVFAAHDVETDTIYVYNTYKRGHAEPSIHVDAIKARGKYIPGAIDPSSAGSSQIDGKKLINEYRDLDLNLFYADNSVVGESGIFAVWKRLSSGRLKVFKSCIEWFIEFRLYRRDQKGNVVKSNDHLMDATRYLSNTIHIAEEQTEEEEQHYEETQQQESTAGWY